MQLWVYDLQTRGRRKFQKQHYNVRLESNTTLIRLLLVSVQLNLANLLEWLHWSEWQLLPLKKRPYHSQTRGETRLAMSITPVHWWFGHFHFTWLTLKQWDLVMLQITQQSLLCLGKWKKDNTVILKCAGTCISPSSHLFYCAAQPKIVNVKAIKV